MTRSKDIAESIIAESKAGDGAAGKAATSDEITTSTESGPVLIRLSDVEPEALEWLWPGRVPIGKLTLVPGDPGLGKSTLTLDIAARVTCGLPWPDLKDREIASGGVVLLSAEDDLADTIRPRLDAAGANSKRIVSLQAIRHIDPKNHETWESAFSLDRDLPALEQAIDFVDDCRLAVIDPISAYLGKTDSHRNAELRGLLAPLAQLAARKRVAVILVTHLRKGEGPALYRAMGSLAFVAAARAVWAVAQDPNDKRRRLFLPVKQNLSADNSGLAYHIDTHPGTSVGVIAWEPGSVEVSIDDVLSAGGAGKPKCAEACQWLTAALSDGPKGVKDLKKLARGDGVAWRTIERAKDQLHVVSKRDGFGDQGLWTWSLPDKAGDETDDDSGGETDGETVEPPSHMPPKDAEHTEVGGLWGSDPQKVAKNRPSGPKNQRPPGPGVVGGLCEDEPP